MKLTKVFAAVLLLFVTATTRAQFTFDWKVLTNEGTSQATVSNFASVNEARTIIDRIISLMNLKVNFEVREANVPNAGAVFYNNKRYILYNPNFIKQIDRAAQNDWASISILAHEIGHHVKGHVFASNGGSSHQNELEADEFSGLVLRKMGATLDDAQLAMKMISGEQGSASHPGKTARLDAIAKGWNVGAPVTNSDVATTRAPQNTTTTSSSGANTTVRTNLPPPSISRDAVLADRQILVDVNFSTDKKNQYFITVQHNVVRWDGNKLVMVGKLAKLKNANYPYYIYDAQKNYVLVSKTGHLVNPKGSNVGYLSLHTSSATAAR
ncbi:MAG: hypothetical protein K0Q66_2154 [Chitinophagaceae bacterium]|nr:hypothetical protein [Chitinophagaceae bacterium]